MSFTPADGGEPIKYVVHEFTTGGGVSMGMFNTDAVSISVTLAQIMRGNILSLTLLSSCSLNCGVW